MHIPIILGFLITNTARGKTTEQAPTKPVWRKPPPEGVVEIVGTGVSSLVELPDGSLLAQNGSTSSDGGRTWSEPRSVGDGVDGNGLTCLNSGAIALTSDDRIWISQDNGETWDAPRHIPMDTARRGLSDTIIQLSGGRLLCPRRTVLGGYHPDDGVGLPIGGASRVPECEGWGTWKGLPTSVEGEGHCPQMEIAFVYYSDDEGRTWNPFEEYGCLMGWFDFDGVVNGNCGVVPCDEPSVAETKDGGVLFFARSTVGRILYSYSRDHAQTWGAVKPTELECSYSPPRLRRIPRTGDLICVWNQVSHAEIRRGYLRGRLSAAISRDSGATWENFKTLELSAGLEDVERIPAEYPIRPVRSQNYVGTLPDDYANIYYPNICFAADKVYVIYSRGWLTQRGSEARLTSERVLRIYPLEWFYQ